MALGSCSKCVVLTTVVAGWTVVGACGRAPDDPETRESLSLEAPSSAADLFAPEPVGEKMGPQERPQIANVQMTDLDKDGLVDILVCDALGNRVSWIRQSPTGVFAERPIGDAIRAPAFAQAVDIDGDGDQDVIVASLGVLLPSNQRIGAVVVLENTGQQVFTTHTVASHIARVAHVSAGDLDGDGDLDLAVAGFGYDSGETLWLENTGGWRFEPHVLQRFSGPINAIIVDMDGDGDLDIVTLVSQEWEDIWLLRNDGHATFTQQLIWGSTNTDFGSSWISVADMDLDGDPDLLYSNGDALDYAPNDSRPWHGVQWLENTGAVPFPLHRIADLSGASSPQAADVDLDGDMDVIVASAYNDWSNPAASSLVLLENDGHMRFRLRPIASSPTHLVTVAVGALSGSGRPDLVTGGLHLSRPYDRMSRVTRWSHREPATLP